MFRLISLYIMQQKQRAHTISTCKQFVQNIRSSAINKKGSETKKKKEMKLFTINHFNFT